MTNLQKHPRSGVYRFRKAVPEDLRAVFGRTEFTETLNTKDLAEAKRRVKEVGLRYDAMIEAARTGRVGITLGEAQQLALAWKAEALQQDEEARLSAPAYSGTVAATMKLVNDQSALGKHLGDLKRAQDRRDYRSVEQTVMSLLTQSGRVVDRRTEGFQALNRLFLQASIDVVNEQINRCIGDLTAPNAAAASPMVPYATVSRQSSESESTPISEILDLWVAERKPPPKTEREWRMAFRRFQEVVGSDIPVQTIRKDHVREFKQALQRMPRVLTAKRRKMTVPQIIASMGELCDDEKLSNVTVNKQLGALSSVLTWAMDNGYIETSPASRVRAKIRSNTKKRFPYDDEDLTTIFCSPIYTTERSQATASQFWLPLMALWMGAREEELGQATVADVRREDGIDYLRIDTVEENQTTKNEGSQRSVPFHPQIIACGFLDYVAKFGRNGHRQLFPELKPNKDGSYTAGWSKWYGRYVRSLGITDTRKVFHSFRHNFKDACRRAGIEEAVHDALTGHSNGSVGRGYGRGFQVATLAKAMNTITYPALDLSHLQKTKRKKL